MSESQFSLALIVGVGALAIVCVLVWRAVSERRRAARFSEPFPPEWRSLLERSLPLYRRMPLGLRSKLEPAVRAFLHDVKFIGCQGLDITDEMRLVIAVQACLLIVERDPHAYAGLASVLLYPDEFLVQESEEDEAGVVTEGERVLSGQSFETARIVLSWRDVQESGGEGDAYNVVLHEFAHFLDNSLDGLLSDADSGHAGFKNWHAVLAREYDALCDAVERGEDTLIDPYGAEHPAELFAVATETFVEQPLDLRDKHPALYAALREVFGLDPANW